MTASLNPVNTIQPVVKPVVKRVDNRFDNRVERTATVRSTDCQTGLYNRFDNRLYTRYSRFVKPVECLYTRYNRLPNRFDNPFDNRLCRVNGA